MSKSQSSPKKRSSSSTNYRSRHREKSHAESAHLVANFTPPKIADLPGVPTGDPELIETQDGLDDVIRRIRDDSHSGADSGGNSGANSGGGVVAFDTEFIGEESYYPRLCVVQLGTADFVALVDPLAEVDLTPVWELLADPSVVKIVHAGRQDLEPVVRHLGKPPANVFDTQVAAGFAGFPYPTGLQKMVQSLLNVKLAKGLTFTHWDDRPLSTMHQHYAADDVRYLPALRMAILERLETLKHVAWADEECSSMCRAEDYVFDAEVQVKRVKGKGRMRPRELAILRELVVIRDTAAKTWDEPPRAVVKDDVMVAMAKEPIKDIAIMAGMRGMPRPFREEYGRQVVEGTARALAIDPHDLPRPLTHEETPEEKMRIDAMWAAVSAYCLGRSIDPGMVGNRHDAAACYRKLTSSLGSEEIALFRGWRQEALEDVVRGFLGENTDIVLGWRKGGPSSSIAGVTQ